MSEEQADPSTAKSAEQQGDSSDSQDKKKEQKPFAVVADSYVRNLGALSTTLPIIMGILRIFSGETRKRFEVFRDEHGKVVDKDENSQTIVFPIEKSSLADELLEMLAHTNAARKIVPKTFLMALVSQYDAFLTRLIETMFTSKPELLAGSERKLTYAELSTLGTLEDARKYILEKEVESVLRDSHAKQFDWLEKKLEIKLRENLTVWPIFVEATERRNLFTHTDGVVSSQYISVCASHGVALPADTKVGVQLSVSRQYMDTAVDACFEIGVKLTHVVWRKLLPKEREAADNNLNSICYTLIKQKRYGLAIVMLDFATQTLKTFSSERTKRTFIINLAQAYKWSGDETSMERVIDAHDWSACGRDFDLCLSALRNDFSAAAEKMRAIGNSGEVNKYAYLDWPVFTKFRESTEFLKAYQDVFGESFVVSKDVPNAKQKDEASETPNTQPADGVTVAENVSG